MSPAPLRLLHVEDDPEDAALVDRSLASLDGPRPAIRRAATLAAGLDAMAERDWDLVLLDLRLPDAERAEAVRAIRARAPRVPIVVLTGLGDDALAAEALEAGAQDVMPKADAGPDALARAIRYAIDRRRLLTGLEQSLAELRASEQRLRAIIGANVDGMVIVGRDRTVLFMNAAAETLLGVRLVDCQGKPFRHPLVAGATREITVKASNGSEPRILELRAVETEWSGEPAQLACVRDITERKRDEETLRALNTRLQQLANVDPLTGLLNRRALVAELYRMTQHARRTGTRIAAALIDCDDFKSVNDSLGHAVGDVVLAQFAQKLRTSVRPVDAVARIGGDEFMLLLPDTRVAEALQIAERARLAVSESPLVVGGRPLFVSASIGLAMTESHVGSLEELLAQTHPPLAASKAAGKNRVTLRSDGAEPETAALTCQREVDRLLDERQPLTAVAQPIFDLTLVELVGQEFLTRGPAGPFAMPADFFRLAAQRRSLTALDLRCLRTTVAAAAASAVPVRAHVNVHPATLLDTPVEGLVEFFRAAHAPDGFCVEISEQQMVGDPARLARVIDGFRSAGVRVAVDDVGFGRSSLESLIVLEPDVVKVDRNYVAGIADDALKARWLRRLLRVVERLGADCVAEGIESADDLQRLKELGVPYGQGFFLGVPAPCASAASGAA